MKTNHKHSYQECLFNNKEGLRRKGEYCTICGKIGDINLFETVRVSGAWRKLTENEICEKYKHLEQVEIEDFYQKYLPIRRTLC